MYSYHETQYYPERVSGIQNARGNKEAFKSLAKDACDLVYVVFNIYKAHESHGRTGMGNDLDDNLKALITCGHKPHLRELNL